MENKKIYNQNIRLFIFTLLILFQVPQTYAAPLCEGLFANRRNTIQSSPSSLTEIKRALDPASRNSTHIESELSQRSPPLDPQSQLSLDQYV